VKTVMSEMGSAMMGTGTATGEGRAREAAERAINSPLLDDIDLSGAKGLLVNITAGLDLSLGEFSEVGEAIEEIACDDATVVIGTVIDPTMSDELKVTVVATGLGVDQSRPVLKKVEPLAPMRSATSTSAAYEGYDLPPAKRQRAAATTPSGQAVAVEESSEEGYFDIPAFLRRQAD
jgi:cell division protein FtsZ